ncbi:MAG TPA: bifunctional UDP-N-acetylglucosamine diphosphorylase/glucosamine-1-phosphate N-acetyltransferase GlmU [Actinopolymorphaceae bacterium]
MSIPNHPDPISPRPTAVIVLAAGKGTRMKSRKSKLLYDLGGRSLLGHVVATARSLQPTHLAVVVGHLREQVVPHLAEIDPDALPVVQEHQRGTGHAVRTALDALPSLTGTVVVTYADAPLLSANSLRELVAGHVARRSAATVLTAVVPDPTGYGRILRDADDHVAGIVEHKDATPEQRAIVEINSGIYAFDVGPLADALARLKTDNSQGEEYLTDVLGILRHDGHQVDAVVADDYRDILGINDQVQLAELRRVLNDRVLDRWMRSGVTVIDPATTWVDVTVELQADVVLRPHTQLHGTTRVAAGAEIGPDTTLIDTVVGEDARVVRTHGTSADIGPRVSVGPFAYLRPGTRLRDGSKVGTFVETKNAEIGPGAKAPHLAYIGDATVGEGTNIGAGTIFANYDGVHKHHTDVGRHVFIGSDSVLVAPRRIADGSYVAAGSTVVKDVEPGELAVARGRQRNIAGWVARKRAGTKTAAAAEEAAATAESGEATDAPGDPNARGATERVGPLADMRDTGGVAPADGADVTTVRDTGSDEDQGGTTR